MIRQGQNIWNGLNRRERLLVALALGLFALLLFWALIYRPVHQYPARQEQAYKRAVLDLKLMQKAQKQWQAIGGQAGPTPKSLTPDAFRALLTRTAAEKDLAIVRRQPKGDREVSLWFEGVDSTALYGWMSELVNTYNISIARAQINREEPAGVRAMISFRLEGN